MGVITTTQEIKLRVSPTRLFKAAILEATELAPKIMPQFVKKVEILEAGFGNVGKVKQTVGTDGVTHKYKTENLDVEKCAIKYSCIEGPALGNKIEFIRSDAKHEASSDGGCIAKIVAEYHTKGDAKLTTEEIKANEDQMAGLYKAVEEYLLANPHACA